MRLHKIVFLFVFQIAMLIVRADEGMWLPQLLEQLNEKKMKAMGMKINARDIYNINKGSLKDAIVSFGGFCTGEVISQKGLILTNHHCGFDAIQNHTTLDRNYIRDGFWAKTHAEELPNPGLFVTFIIRIEDVTKQVLKDVTSSMTEKERQSIIEKNSAASKMAVKKESYQNCFIRSFFEGNRYYLFVTEQYNDVRLVGAPPGSIGNFGKDSDNWMWPRHTGDFSLFRIYAGKDNKPANYSPDNVPYVPKKSLSISLAGVKEGDFTMVLGFPGRTTQYLPAAAVKQIVTVNDPVKIAIRDRVLSIMDQYMRMDEQIKIQYASKYAGISNGWKKWKGEVMGLTSTNAVQKKKQYEAEFLKRVQAHGVWNEQYGHLLDQLEKQYHEWEYYSYARDVFNETISRIEIFTMAAQYHSLVTAYEQNGQKGYEAKLQEVKIRIDELLKEWSLQVDRSLFHSLISFLRTDRRMEFLQPVWSRFSTNDTSMVTLDQMVYGVPVLSDTVLANNKGLFSADGKTAIEAIKKDSVYQLYLSLIQTYSRVIAPSFAEYQGVINRLQRMYMGAQMEVMKDKVFYPDANNTFRVTYGKVKGYHPRDGVEYGYYTYLDGLMEKYKPGDYEFDVSPKLQELYRKKDYGAYGVKGKLPVCFIAMNHTTGGNSGSPALDANGNLIGLNFDRVWEGTMSDIYYDPSICRNVMADIRYILFVIDKFANAGHLLKEMHIISNK